MSIGSPNPPPSNPPVKIEVRPVSSTEGMIKWNGEEYLFTVHEFEGRDSSGDKWKNVTNEKDWRIIATRVAELFQKSANATLFEKGEIIVSGDLKDADATTLDTTQVTVHSGEVIYRETPAATGLKVQKFAKEQAVAFSRLATLADKFRSNASSQGSSNPQTSPPASQTEYPFNDIQTILEGRNPQFCDSHTSADYALADQLGKMENFGNCTFKGSQPDAIVASLRSTISQNIKDEQNKWVDDHFPKLFKSLKKAAERYDQALETASSENNCTIQALKQELSKSDNDATLDKQRLIKIYADYIKNGRAILDGTYFNAFVNCYSRGDLSADVQVVLMKGDGKRNTEMSCFPNRPIIFPPKCAFLFLNTTTGEYSSYPRAPDSTSQIDAAKIDLNTFNTHLNIKTAIRIPISIDTTGRCLDMSIAYQVLQNHYPDLNHDQLMRNKDQMKRLADDLRNKAAELIKSKDKNDDENFMEALKQSIRDIPAFTDPSTPITRQDSAKIKPLLSDDAAEQDAKFNQIKQILSKPELSPNEKTLLRTFYASYITQPLGNSGEMSNYLDSAFLRVLPEIKHDQFLHGIKVVVIKENARLAFPPDEPITSDWVYVQHQAIPNETLHYNALLVK